MEDVAKHPWLWERREKNGTRMFYLRARVPKDLRKFYKGENVKKSLRTQDRKEANSRIKAEAAALQEEFDAHRRSLTGKKTSDVTKAQLGVLAAKWFQVNNQAALDEWLVLDEVEREPSRNVIRDDLIGLSNLDDPHVYQHIADKADALLEKNGILLNASGWLYEHLARLLHSASMELLERQLARVDGDFDAANEKRFDGIRTVQPVEITPRTDGSSSTPLSSLIDAFMDDPSGKSREDKTNLGYDYTFRLMKEIMGTETPSETINREHCRMVRDTLITMPPNATKKFPSMTLVQAAEHGKAKGLEPMAPATINSYVSKMSSFFGWALREQYINANPAQRLMVLDDRSDEDKRHPFSIDQLKLIFNAPLYRGCKNDERGYGKPGDRVIRRARFWVPLISLFHGMRLNEICQLSLDDIEVEEGIDYINIRKRDQDQKEKSRAARRKIPLHPELKRMGFLEYVADKRQQGETKLFPELKKDGRGYYSGLFDDWFARFLVKTKVKTKKTTFHSFRHSWTDAMRNEGVDEPIIDRLGGWSHGGSTQKIYGSGYKLKLLADQIAKIGYEGLDLSHLYL